MSRKQRRAKPVKGGRDWMSTGLDNILRDEILYLSRRFGVSRSWIIRVALADAFGYGHLVERYDDIKPHNLRRVK